MALKQWSPCIWLLLATHFFLSVAQEMTKEVAYPPDGYMLLVAKPEISKEDALKEYCESFVPRTYLSAKECAKLKTTNPFVTSSRPVLMTGIGRSGTSFLASLFKGAGLDVHHDSRSDCKAAKECPGADGAVSWPQAFSDQPFKVESGERHCPLASFTWTPTTVSFDVVIHVVRNPLKTIDSRWNKGKLNAFLAPTLCNTVATVNSFMSYTDMVQGYFGYTPTTGATLRFTLAHWVLWNLFVEAQSTERYRIEDFTTETARDICVNHMTPNHGKSSCPALEKFQTAPTISNHGHTVHAPQSYVTWSSLSSLDSGYTALAQKMALRYGYEIKHHDMLDDAKDPLKREKCKFRKSDGRWKCRLKTYKS